MSRTEMKGLSERERQRQNNDKICVLILSTQIVSLGTKPFVIFRDALFKVV